jgi:F0F1-type ATP synthase epsilon subunit
MAQKQKTFELKVLSPTNKYYQGPAVSLSASNKAGPFDILESHVNFFSLLKPGTVKINTGTQVIEIKIDSGIIKVSRDNVILFFNV